MAVVLFASELGRGVDRARSRLKTLLSTVAVNRVVVVAACVCWVVIIDSSGSDNKQRDIHTSMANSTTTRIDARQLKLQRWRDVIFLLVLVLGIIERLSRLANPISMERDWVPTMVAAGTTDHPRPPYDLSPLNAAMSRIDLVCKLRRSDRHVGLRVFGPLAAIGSGAADWRQLLLTWPVEEWTAKQVWLGNEQLRKKKSVHGDGGEESTYAGEGNGIPDRRRDLASALSNWVFRYARSWQHYFATDV